MRFAGGSLAALTAPRPSARPAALVIGEGALATLPAFVAAAARRARPWSCSPRRPQSGWADLWRSSSALGARFALRWCVLGAADGAHADELTVAAATAAARAPPAS